jgi:hypothetical protein
VAERRAGVVEAEPEPPVEVEEVPAVKAHREDEVAERGDCWLVGLI